MKTARSLSTVLGFGLLAFTAAAQQEQWLQYHTSSEPRGYRWAEVSTTPPANVAWPKLQSTAFYGCWSNALDGARWFCLDRSGRSGPYDRIYFDRNGDGRVDDEVPIKAARRDSNTALFDPIKLVFKGEDGPITYHLIVRFYDLGDGRAQLLTAAGGWYEGNVTLAGKKRLIQLRDNNVNGTFNDSGQTPADSDQIMIGGEAGLSRSFGKYLELDDQLLSIEVPRDGAFIKAKKAEGVVTGKVRVPETISEFAAVGENGHFVRKPVHGELTLPAGKYRIQQWTINRKDNQGAAWTLVGSSFGNAADFVAGANDPATLRVGEPIRAVLQAVELKPEISFNLRMLGSLGESIQMMRGSEQPRAPRLLVASADGKFRSTDNFAYG